MDPTEKAEVKRSDGQLKHLGFVRMIVINSLLRVLNLYEYAKQNSGPLKSTVRTVESTVTTIIGPVYVIFKGMPDNLLVFLDEKVGEVANKFDEHAPPSAKQAATKAQSMVHKASEVAQSLIREALVGGPSAAFHYAGSLYVHLFFSAIARFWYVMNQITALHVLAQMAAPTVSRWLDKYDGTIVDLAAKGYTLFSHFPRIPMDEIAKAYKQVEAERGPACASCAAERVPEWTRQM